MKQQYRSIKQKLGLTVGIGIILISGILIAYTSTKTKQKSIRDAESIAVEAARNYAGQVKSELEVALNESRALAQSLSGIKANDSISFTRPQVNAMLHSFLRKNEDFLGVYTGWEPNAFDGADAQYTNSPGHDETGRFIPYWVREANGRIIREPLKDYQQQEAGAYYQLPKKKKQEVIIDPFYYSVGSEEVLLISLVTPIMNNGQFYGITGVDYSVDFLQNLVEDHNLYNGKATLSIVSNQGRYVANSANQDLLGENLQTVHQNAEEQINNIQRGNQHIQNQDDQLQVFVPIQLGKTDSPWQVRVGVPNDLIVEEANQMMRNQIIIGGILTILGVSLLIFFVGRLVNPLKELRDIAREVSEGNLKVRADIRQNDEIGTLGQAINQMVYKLREIVENIQIISYFSIEEKQNSGFQTTSKSSVNAGSGNGNHSSSSTREYQNNTYSAGNQQKEYTENGAGMKTKQSNNGQ